MGKFETDLNHRERAQFAKEFRQLAEYSTKTAEALEAENDTEALTNFLMLAFSGPSLTKKLTDVFQEQMDREKITQNLD